MIILVSLLHRCSDQAERNPYSGMKSMTYISRSMTAKKDLESSMAEKTIYTEFDINGNTVFVKSKSWRGNEEIEYKYDNKGQMVESFSEMYFGIFC